MRGLTLEELDALRELAGPNSRVVQEDRMEIDERLVEQGRATELVVDHDETYEYVEWNISPQGIAALNLYALIGERMLT